jgi:hypothetical protein
MRKEVLCVMGVLLGGALARAQQAPYPAANAYYQDPSQAAAACPAACGYAAPSGAEGANYSATGGYYPDPYGYGSYPYGYGYDPNYPCGYGYGYGYGASYPAGYGWPGSATPEAQPQPPAGSSPAAGAKAEGKPAAAAPSATAGQQAPAGAQASQGTQAAQGSSEPFRKGRVAAWLARLSRHAVPAAAPAAVPAPPAPVKADAAPAEPAKETGGITRTSYMPTGCGLPASVVQASVPEEELVTVKTPGAGPPLPPGPGEDCNECVWLSANYRLSWFRPGPLNAPLVSTGSAASPRPGALSQPDAVPIFGPGNLDFNSMSGIEFAGGFFLDHDHHWSLDAGGFYYFTGHIKSLFASDAAGNPVIARPAINGANGQEIAFVDSLPRMVAGSSFVDASSEVWSFEVNGRYNVCCTPWLHTDFLLGYRQLTLREKLTVQDQLTPLVPNFLTFRGAFVNPPNTLADVDQFATSDTFYGLNLGTRFLWQYHWLSLDLYGKLAVGVIDEKAHIQGQTSLITRTQVITTPGGVLALPSNIGNHSRSVFGILPETGFNIGIDVLKHVRILTGYSFLLLNSAVRPGNEIDRIVNPGLVPTDQRFGTFIGGPHPQFAFRDQAFWAHTFNFGLEFYY